MPATSESWARGYARQALSDLRAWQELVDVGARVEKCHRLHFLQMAAEKACKAHMASSGHEKVKKSHACVEKQLPIIARVFYARINDHNQIRTHELSEIKRLAHEIEVLAPACDGGEFREDNSEYPWKDGKGDICIPCEYPFPKIDDASRAIIRLIKLIREAAESYSE